LNIRLLELLPAFCHPDLPDDNALLPVVIAALLNNISSGLKTITKVVFVQCLTDQIFDATESIGADTSFPPYSPPAPTD
jgi:hypothetical protein